MTGPNQHIDFIAEKVNGVLSKHGTMKSRGVCRSRCLSPLTLTSPVPPSGSTFSNRIRPACFMVSTAPHDVRFFFAQMPSKPNSSPEGSQAATNLCIVGLRLQVIQGFGGAFTEASALVFQGLGLLFSCAPGDKHLVTRWDTIGAFIITYTILVVRHDDY